MKRDRYDISGSSYTQTMDEKSTQYANLIRRAEERNRDMDGKPTKEEANFYYQAAKVCEELMSMNLSQRAVYAQWNYRKMDCESNFNRIADILAPPPPPKKEEPAPQKQPQSNNSAVKTASADTKAPTTSKSGFTTEHASKEVPVEMIEKWFQEVSGEGFDHVIGRTELKKRLLNEAAGFGWNKVDSALNINPVQCYFLYGPPGTGKTHLINAFASELAKKGFHFMQLVGSDIHASYVGVAEKIVTAAFAVAAEKEPCLIFIDEIDNLCVSRDSKAEGHEKRLTVAFMEAYNRFKKSGKRLIFMGATNHPGMVDEAMLDRITLIKIPLPAEEDRIGYFDRMTFENEAGKSKLTLEPGFTVEDMASVTDNYSYRDLDRLRDFMLAKLKGQAIQDYEITDENGNVDQAATDERASQAIINGEVMLTRALFEQTRKENPPSDKTRSRQELKEFEERAAAVNS